MPARKEAAPASGQVQRTTPTVRGEIGVDRGVVDIDAFALCRPVDRLLQHVHTMPTVRCLR